MSDPSAVAPTGSDDALRGLERRYLPRGAPGRDHVVWASAEGSWVHTVDGRRLVDFTSGVLIANAGHAHPLVTAAIAAQAARGIATYTAPHPLRGPYCRRLVEAAGAPFEAVALLNTGSEAVDAAVRVARAATGATGVLTFGDGFHGRTTATAAMSGLPWARPAEGPPAGEVLVAPFPNPYRPPPGLDPTDLGRSALDLARELVTVNAATGIAAVLVEPYLGAGGAVVAPDGFLAGLRALADELGALLVLDEVQSGFGRTGRLFAFQHPLAVAARPPPPPASEGRVRRLRRPPSQGLGLRPDLVAAGKGIASGFPMAALLGTRAHLDALPAGTLWNSYGGGPLACAAADATLDVLLAPGVLERVDPLGERIRSTIAGWDRPGIGDVRGWGLSLGVELVRDRGTREPDPDGALALVRAAAEHGVLLLPPAGRAGNVVRIAPPLTISDAEADHGLDALLRGLRAVGR